MREVVPPVDVSLVVEDAGVMLEALARVLVIVDDPLFRPKLLLERQRHRIANTQVPIDINRLVEDRDAAYPPLLPHLPHLCREVGTFNRSLERLLRGGGVFALHVLALLLGLLHIPGPLLAGQSDS